MSTTKNDVMYRRQANKTFVAGTQFGKVKVNIVVWLKIAVLCTYHQLRYVTSHDYTVLVS